MGAFDRFLGKIVDSTLGFRCKLAGYRYSEILRSLMCVYFCGGSCIEDVSSHLMPYLSQHPTLRTCSSDTILRSIEELTEDNIKYVSDLGRPYEFNPAEKLNSLLFNVLLETGHLVENGEYDLDFNHQFIEAEKYDSKTTYKKFKGYGPGVAVINDLIAGVENRDGNANVRFHQGDTLEKIFCPIGGKGTENQPIKDGLQLLFGRNRRDGREALLVFLYSCQPLCVPIR